MAGDGALKRSSNSVEVLWRPRSKAVVIVVILVSRRKGILIAGSVLDVSGDSRPEDRIKGASDPVPPAIIGVCHQC